MIQRANHGGPRTIGLYTDESPGLIVDPVVVLVLSLVFIFSVVALHSMSGLRYSSEEPDC